MTIHGSLARWGGKLRLSMTAGVGTTLWLVSLLLLFNQPPPYFQTLLRTARRLVDEDEYAIAVVVAHMAFEVATEQAFSRLLQADGITRDLEEPLLAMLSDRTFQAKTTRELWSALTKGDDISKAEGWKKYDASVKVRNQAVHAGEKVKVDQAQAEDSLDSVAAVIAHIRGVAGS